MAPRSYEPDAQLARSRSLQPGDEVEQRRLAGTRRPQQRDPTAGGDVEVDAAQRDDLGAVLGGVDLHETGRSDVERSGGHGCGHACAPRSTSAPAVRTASRAQAADTAP
jgi:hypothetical protein